MKLEENSTRLLESESRVHATIDDLKYVLTFGRQTKANEFEGRGGPEGSVEQAVIDRPGDQDVTANVR
jgi:hypothetical protein